MSEEQKRQKAEYDKKRLEQDHAAAAKVVGTSDISRSKDMAQVAMADAQKIMMMDSSTPEYQAIAKKHGITNIMNPRLMAQELMDKGQQYYVHAMQLAEAAKSGTQTAAAPGAAKAKPHVKRRRPRAVAAAPVEEEDFGEPEVYYPPQRPYYPPPPPGYYPPPMGARVGGQPGYPPGPYDRGFA